jgi:formate hydrogenlyase subunit 3/multisubunit Na+/H+ antiporter MnhD subunit
LLNAAYFLPIVYHGFFTEEDPPRERPGEAAAGEAPFLAVAPPVLTAVGSIFLFFHPGPFTGLVNMVVGRT